MKFKNENAFDKFFRIAEIQTGVRKNLLKAIAATESGFDPNAFRNEPQIADASRGLMQILYKTAVSVGMTLPAKDLFRPEINLKYAGIFLAGLLKKYKNEDDAIASYNMGFPRLYKNTTPAIKKIYPGGNDSWHYANQPYVDQVKKFLKYFDDADAAPLKKNGTSISAVIPLLVIGGVLLWAFL